MATASSAFTMEQAQVKLIPSRVPSFFIIVGMLAVIHGSLWLLLNFALRRWVRRLLTAAVSWTFEAVFGSRKLRENKEE
jgi:uncharacterized membrane protein